MVDFSNISVDIHGELARRMGIEFMRADQEAVTIRMPVEGNRQGAFILHGGANGVLVEHAGSVLALLNSPRDRIPVGSELNVSQLHPARQGYVTAHATVISQGRSSICTSVEIRDDDGHLTCVGRLSLVYVRADSLHARDSSPAS